MSHALTSLSAKIGRRRVAVAASAAVLAGALLIVVLAAGWAGSGNSGVTEVGGSTSAVVYSAGHRPLAPDFTATTLTGSRLSFSAYRGGQVVVLNFWGSWCVPCRHEAPTLAAVAAQYRPSGVSFLGVDVRDTTASAEAFARSFGITYPSVSDPSSLITLDFTAKVPIAGTPTTLVIDRTGRIAGAVFGAATYPELTTILAKVTATAAG
ncbi:MAG: TlpA family protein disulfide reductase [Actinobacteria bacterium]|nr:TlpA family protein disulfide reductase [Actinomycetota bacterium]